MSKIKSKDLADRLGELKRQYPSLEDRFDRYRERREAYERKRGGQPGGGGSPAPAERRARRDLV